MHKNSFFYQEKTLLLELKKLCTDSPLFDMINDAAMLQSIDGSILAANSAACKMYGYSKEDILNVKVKDLVPSDHHFEIEEARKLLAKKKHFKFETVNIRRNGEIFPVEVSGTALSTENEKAALILVRDMSEHKKLEKELRKGLKILESKIKERTKDLIENEERYRTLFENASDPILEIDSKGRFININRAGLELGGYSREEAIGKPFVEVIHPDDLPIAASVFERVMRGETVEGTICIRVIRKDGKFAQVEYRTSPHYKDGTIIGIQGVARDVTEQKKIEQRLRENERLAQLGRFVASIAHEIKNPLFGISSIAQVLSSMSNDPKSRELSDAMLSEVKRLNNLIKELMQFAKPRETKAVRFTLKSFFAEISKIHQSRADRMNLKMDFKINHGNLTIETDKDQASQIVTNLLINALQFSPKGETVTIKSNIDKDENEWIISVHNLGPHIPPENMDKIFEPFFSTRGKGTGLGLAISKRTAAALGGDISVESSKQNGTTFILKIPVKICEENKNFEGM